MILFLAILVRCVKKSLRNLEIGVKESVERKNASFQSCDSGALSQASQPVSGSMPMERTDPVRFSPKPGETSRVAVARLQHSSGERRKIITPEDPLHGRGSGPGRSAHHAPHPSYE